jgi:hypothetical protein
VIVSPQACNLGYAFYAWESVGLPGLNPAQVEAIGRYGMHTDIDKNEPTTELRSEEAPIYLPPAGDNLEAWRDLPYSEVSWLALLSYWVNELRWRRSHWAKTRR